MSDEAKKFLRWLEENHPEKKKDFWIAAADLAKLIIQSTQESKQKPFKRVPGRKNVPC